MATKGQKSEGGVYLSRRSYSALYSVQEKLLLRDLTKMQQILFYWRVFTKE